MVCELEYMNIRPPPKIIESATPLRNVRLSWKDFVDPWNVSETELKSNLKRGDQTESRMCCS